MKTYIKPELKELILAPQEYLSSLSLTPGDGTQSDITVDGDDFFGD